MLRVSSVVLVPIVRDLSDPAAGSGTTMRSRAVSGSVGTALSEPNANECAIA